MLGFFTNYGVAKQYADIKTQWMLSTLLHPLPTALCGIRTREEAGTALSKLRHLPVEDPVVAGELYGMDSQLLHEHESVGSASSDAITQYSRIVFGYLSIVGDDASFLVTGICGVVKFVGTLLFACEIVDFVGRRRSLLNGISLQILTLAFVGAYLGATKDMTTDEIKASPKAERFSTAAIVAISLHAVTWSIGWFSIPYLIGPEIFPTRIRSLNLFISIALHWAFYFGCSKAMSSPLAATHRRGYYRTTIGSAGAP
ncbi:hypothetical protein N7505_007423 [Penicillium chrysogenum]|uniref:Quinate permease n=1 Tax=Penicillium chrysogenum TaxID=5076 RepID=A0ABQ8WDJ7_PENCH|nr:hypothetical protein N7505_007423 [Penicillium chrysogenum]